MTSNTGNPPPTTDDWNEEDDEWNLDGVQPSLPSSSIQPAATSSDDTTPKVVASATSTGNISGAAAAHSNPGRPSLSSRPSAYISAIPAGYEDNDDYINYYRPDNPRLIASRHHSLRQLILEDDQTTDRYVDIVLINILRHFRALHHGTIGHMAKKRAAKRLCRPGHSAKWLGGIRYHSRSIRNPRNALVNAYTLYSSNYDLGIRQSLINELDLATAYKSMNQLSIFEKESVAHADHAFEQSSSPSPTSSELQTANDNANIQLEDSSDEDVPELVPNTNNFSSDSDSDEAYRIREKRIRLPTKRRYLAYSSRVSYSSIDSTDEETKCQHKPLHRDTWTACPRRIEQ